MIICAEIGLNHDGNFDLAYELIRQAKLSGADIAKFQLGWRAQPGEMNQIDLERCRQLKAWCESFGVEFMASIFTEEAFAVAREVDPARYKIASRTVEDNPDLCRRILREGKETYVSLGMWDGPAWPLGAPSERLRYLYCRSKYPAYPRDMAALPAHFAPDGWFGYSDHMHGVGGCLLAISRGAQYIEKHFTLNKASSVIRDHVLSATPEEFRQLTTLGREINGILAAAAASAPLIA
jgi:sialic acid synthase SpsE